MIKRFITASVVSVATVGTLGAASNSNFQIAPPPIAYPYFEAGRGDGKIEPMLISIESKEAEMSLAGAGINMVGRQAFSEWIALDVQAGLFALNGQTAGIPPITPIPTTGAYSAYTYYYTRVDGKAQVNMTSFVMSFNIELQPIKEDFGNLILFFGPNFGVSSMTMRTPYSLIVPSPYSNAGDVFSGYTDTLTFSGSTSGAQFGMQAGFALGHGLQISPFFMMSSASGTATLTDDPGTGNAGTTSVTADIPESSTTSFGMDIVIDEMSLGTIFQNIQSQDSEEQGDINIVMFRFGFHF